MKTMTILFLCTGNSCRSQMAEGWAHQLLSENIKAYSAGIVSHGINSSAVAIMKEVGVDISNQDSEALEELGDIHFDWVVTLCDHAHEMCPVFPSATQVIHVGFPDPPRLAKEVADAGGSVEEQLDCYRQVRDEIKVFIQEMAKSF